MLKCKVCGKELIKNQKATCSVDCRKVFVGNKLKGRVSPFKGLKGRWNEEQKKQIGLSQKGSSRSDEFKEKCRKRMKGIAFFKGHKHTEEWKQRMSEEMKIKGGWRKAVEKNIKHGLSKTTEYKIWVAMKGRCYNKKVSGYKNYGGRGISVCKRWRESFENFFEDMGERPSSKFSIDRVDNNGNYEPSNCRWATSKQQYDNSRLKQDKKGRFKRTA